jgi:hypothetical protein
VFSSLLSELPPSEGYTMKWKILAFLSPSLCANLAFGQVLPGDPSGVASYSYVLQGVTSEIEVNDITGSGEGPPSPSGWNVIDSIDSFTNPSGGGAQVSVFPTPFVSASASSVAPAPPTGVVSPGTPPPSQTASNYTLNQMGLTYYLQANSPDSTAPVTVFWNGSYSLSGATTGIDGITAVNATISVGSFITGPSVVFEDTCAEESACPAGLSSVFTGSIDASPRAAIQVILGATAYSENGGPNGGAYIDPYFYLSPAEIAAGDTLGFSVSVGNAPSPVPLPAADGLLLSGLGLLAMAVWRRTPAVQASRR